MDINVAGFLPALLPVALSPGASFTLVMSSALGGGRRGLYKTLAGTALGIFTHALLLGLGVSAVIIATPAMYGVLKIAGTAYLLWLGVMLIVSGMKTRHTTPLAQLTSVSVKQAWLANVLNPKAIMFYLTVVSQFAGQEGGVSHFLALACIHVGVMSIWLIAISHLLIFSAKKANPVVLKKVVNLAGGLLLIIFSLHSATQ